MTKLPSLHALETAAAEVYRVLTPTPQITWPLLNERAGCEVWLKHENHNPTGAFKVRGGLVYMARLASGEDVVPGICTATRGNHGQSVAFAAGRHGLEATVVVPEGNSPDKNAAMRAYGANLLVHGADFDAAVEHARALAEREGLLMLPSFHMDLVAGVASYALELFRHVGDIDRIYVPIGLGSGAAGVIAVRNALGLETEVIGVVSENARTYDLSMAAGEVVPTNSADTMADGLAVRQASDIALGIFLEDLARVVTVTDDEIMAAMGACFADTHNVAEGAGASGIAAILKEKGLNEGCRVATVVTGGNVNAAVFCRALDLCA